MWAFADCTNLKNITIPDSLTSIDYSTFEGCTSLAYCNDNNGKYLGNSENPYLVLIDVIDTAASDFTISNATKVIGSEAFSNCTNLKSIIIPDSVTSIGNSAFKGCTNLKSITIPDSVASIGSFAFEDCTSLKSITLPDSVTSIGSLAFDGCTGLKSITLPDSVTSIGQFAFRSCTNLASVYYTGTATEWGKINIDDTNSDLTDATIYYYSETQPTAEGNYWHYVNGVATPW